ncbi:MAG: carboxypeptidase-like regulatory domain-containing protein [Patescibacteria group bacterium]
MKKILLILLLIFSLFFFLNPLFAQTPTPTPDPDIQSSYTMECLELPSDIKENKTKTPPPVLNTTLSGNCSNKNGCYLAMCVISLKDLGHLSFDEFNAQHPSIGEGSPKTYIELLKTFEGNLNEYCTTGKSDRDLFYFGQDFTSILDTYNLVPQNTTSFTSSKLTDNFIPYGPVNIPITLNNPNDHVYYTFYAISSTGNLSANSQTPTPGPTNSETNENSQKLSELKGLGTQQIGTPTDGTKEKCVNIAWDPYGRLFDGVSLEPLNKDEATVTLLDKNGNQALIPNNNVKIDRLGKYNIMVREDGEYKLNVIPYTSHKFTNFSPDIRYKSLYETIFMPLDPAFFESSSNPKRVDIALKPADTPYKRPIEVVQNEYKQVWTGGKKYIKITLRVTHPLSLVKLIVNNIVVKDNGDGELLPTMTDKNGFWKVLVRDYKVLSQNGFRIQVAKNPAYYLYAGQSDDKITLDYDQILPYVEGYAYDGSGKIIANAIIQVKLKMNGSTFYQTNTNENGYFIIQPKNLPPLDYYFIFVDPKDKSEYIKTTAKFVSDNNVYLTQEKIDLLKGTRKGQVVINNEDNGRSDSYVENSQNNINNNSNNNSLNNLLNNGKETKNKLILGLAILLLLLIAVFVFAFFYFKKNN